MKKILTTFVMAAFVLTMLFSVGLAKSNDAWLGVTIQTVDRELAKAFDIPSKFGVVINEIIEDSPAEKSDLKEGDVIVAIDGEKIYDSDELIDYINDMEPGDNIVILVLRDGDKVKVNVELGESSRKFRMKNNFDFDFDFDDNDNDNDNDEHVFYFDSDDDDDDAHEYRKIIKLGDLHELAELKELTDMPNMFFSPDGNNLTWVSNNGSYIGVQLTELTDQLRSYFGVKEGRGVLISAVNEDSPAEKAGLKAGDVIISIDGDDVESYGEVKEAVTEKDEGEKVEVTVIRNNRASTFSVEVDQREDHNNLFYQYKAPDISLKMPKHKSGNFTFYSDDDKHFNSDEYKEAMKAYKVELEKLKKELKKMNLKKNNDYKEAIEELRRELKELKKKLDD